MTATRRQIEDELVALLAPLKKQTLGGGSNGYLLAVKEYNGEKLEDIARELVGQKPAVLVQTIDAQYEKRDVRWRRAKMHLEIELRIVSGTLRSRFAQIGGPPAGVADADPGIFQIEEDIRDILMGLTSSVPGVGTYEPETFKPEFTEPNLSVWVARYSVPVDVERPAAAAPALTQIVGQFRFPRSDETLLAGTGGTLSVVGGGTMQLAVTGGAFTAAMVGAYAVIAGSTNPANAGSFQIVAVPSPNAIQFTNPAGIAEGFTGSWSVIPAPFITIEKDM